jgi:hypothetical protein
MADFVLWLHRVTFKLCVITFGYDLNWAYAILVRTSAMLQSYKVIAKVQTKKFAEVQLRTFESGLPHFYNT